MKRILPTFILLLSSFLVFSQEVKKVFHEVIDKLPVLYASNSELYPISISLELELTNYTFSEGNKRIFVIPPKTEKLKLGGLTVGNSRERATFGYKYKVAMGDVTNKKMDKDYQYDLPFQKGESYKLWQGYNGSFSHQDENSLDFTMPEGTKIVAAREGVVVKVVQNNTQSCNTKECAKYNNYVTILHPDGTFANYVHIKFNGAVVKQGDEVKKGALIAHSGNVGWSSAPHLHFVCYAGDFGKRNTLETKFKIDAGNKSIILKEGTVYTRNY